MRGDWKDEAMQYRHIDLAAQKKAVAEIEQQAHTKIAMSAPNSRVIAKIQRAEARVVLAAMALCREGRGFCYNDECKISDPNIGRRLERACAHLKKVRNQ